MTNIIRSLVPMAFVLSVDRSIEFYAKLDFQVRNTFAPPGSAELHWAWLESDGAHLMLAKASDPVSASEQAILFYLYCDDVAAMKASLEARGVETSAIAYPFYAPKGEFRLSDPDGYSLVITHS